MKPAAPMVLRKGSIVRVGGDVTTVGAVTVVLSFVDLRYREGYVERWIGPGAIYDLPGGDDVPAKLVKWGEEVSDMQEECLLKELAMDFSGVDPQALAGVPVEVVVEWHATLNLPPGV